MQLKKNPIYDFSSWEDNIKWDQMTGENKPAAVFLRASYQQVGSRVRGEDKTAVPYSQKCREYGIPFGLYHFLTPNGIAEQADLFMQVWNECGGANLAPVVDVEIDLQLNYSKSPSIIGNQVWQNHIKTFIDIIASKTDKTPMIYTSQKYWIFACTKNIIGGFVPPSWTNDYPLWVAQYPLTPDTWDKPTAMPLGFTDWEIWQYAENGRQNGFLANDLNTATDAFIQEIGGVVVVPPPDETEKPVEYVRAVFTDENGKETTWLPQK